MKKENQSAEQPVKVGSYEELEERYDLTDVRFLPPELATLSPGEEVSIARGKFIGHFCLPDIYLSQSGLGLQAIDFTEDNGLFPGKWVYEGIVEAPRAYWLNKKGERVMGIGAKVALFSRKHEDYSSVFLVRE